MKCPSNEVVMERDVKNQTATDCWMFDVKSSPVKEDHASIKPHHQCLSAASTPVLFSDKNNTGAIHNKENNVRRTHEGALDECFEDSGYLSLHNSQIHDPHEGDIEQVLEKPPSAATQQEKTLLSPFKCQNGTKNSYIVSVATPLDKGKKKFLSSTPSNQTSNLPILKFQKDVCGELEKCFKKNKRYDWSIVSKVAEDHLLDRVIGRHMGLEHVDIFAFLLSRNMKTLLTKILCQLEDMDLISCKKVSRTWKKIIFEDTAALKRCQQAEEAFRESSNSLRTKTSGLTRDVAISRVVFSCVQSQASSQCSSSVQNCGITRHSTSSQKENTPKTQKSPFDEFFEAARTLKHHESLRRCKRCGSPATHVPEMHRATCRRSSCLFDFCTCCHETFHGSTPCRTVQPRMNFSSSKAIKPGSARSLRRL